MSSIPVIILTSIPREADPYLPKGTIKCSFGPFNQQECINMKPLDTLDMSKFILT